MTNNELREAASYVGESLTDEGREMIINYLRELEENISAGNDFLLTIADALED